MIRIILAALDDSPRAHDVLATALEVGERFGAVVHLFRAIDVPPEFPPAAHVTAPDALPHMLEREAMADLSRLAATDPRAARSPLVVERGQAWRAILDAAEQRGADLIVLGSHGYHGFDRLLGTTAGKVANLATRNVFVVHARGGGAVR